MGSAGAMSAVASIGGDAVDDTTDLSSIATLNAFLPNVAPMQTTATNVAATSNSSVNTSNSAVVDEHNFASVSMLFTILFL